MSVKAGGRVELGHHAVTEHRDLISHRKGFVLVVGDEDRRGAGLAEDAEHVRAHRCPQRCVERREGLVEEDDLRLDGQRPRQGDSLLLAAR